MGKWLEKAKNCFLIYPARTVLLTFWFIFISGILVKNILFLMCVSMSSHISYDNLSTKHIIHDPIRTLKSVFIAKNELKWIENWLQKLFYVRDRALRISFIMAENKLCNKGAWQSIRQIYIRFLFLEYLLWIIYVMYAIRGMHMNIFICDRFSMRYLDLLILPLEYHPRLPQLMTVINIVKFPFVLLKSFIQKRKI